MVANLTYFYMYIYTIAYQWIHPNNICKILIIFWIKYTSYMHACINNLNSQLHTHIHTQICKYIYHVLSTHDCIILTRSIQCWSLVLIELNKSWTIELFLIGKCRFVDIIIFVSFNQKNFISFFWRLWQIIILNILLLLQTKENKHIGRIQGGCFQTLIWNKQKKKKQQKTKKK